MVRLSAIQHVKAVSTLLYRAVIGIAREYGCNRIVTYTLADHCGAGEMSRRDPLIEHRKALEALGWRCDGVHESQPWTPKRIKRYGAWVVQPGAQAHPLARKQFWIYEVSPLASRFAPEPCVGTSRITLAE